MNKNSMGKKGAAVNVSNIVFTLIGLLIVIVMIVAVAPTMFANINATGIPNAPSFFITIFPILIAAGLVFLAWRAISTR